MRYLKDIVDYDHPMYGEGPYYTMYYGHLVSNFPESCIDMCNWHETSFPYLAEHKTRLIERFNATYKFREIGQETPCRFAHFLQMRLDEVAEHYDHMYKVFKENNVDELGTGYSDTEEHNMDRLVTSESANTRNDTSEYKDTPISGRINNPTTKTEDGSKSNSDSNVAQNDTYTLTKKRTQHDEHMIDELNKLTEKYVSVDNEFLESFNELFMGIEYTGEIEYADTRY